MLWHSITQLLYRIGIYSEGSGDTLKGIDGWLLLPLLQLLVITVSSFVGMIVDVIQLASADTWQVLRDSDSRFYVYIFYIFASKIITLLFSVYTLFLFCKKSYRLPNVMINYIVFLIIFSCLDIGVKSYFRGISASANEQNVFDELARDAIKSVIWIMYFLKSVRVKNTFVKK